MRIMSKSCENNKGFTLMEMLIVIAIIVILIVIALPALSKHLEKSREVVDIANVRSAYAELITEAMIDDKTDEVRIVKLKQHQDDWQTMDPVTIADVTHYKKDGDTDNWKGIPVANGICEVSYDPSIGVIFNWKGSNGGNTDPGFGFNNNVHDPLNRTDILFELVNSNNKNFEIDSQCPNSDMVNKIKAEIESDSIMKYGTWAYLGDPNSASDRYFFWTSVNTNEVGVGKKIPVIVSRADGGFYISETTTAQRKKDGKDYVAIADHVYNSYGFKQYTKGDRYDSLEDAYKAYSKLFEDGKYPDYKDTLPQ